MYNVGTNEKKIARAIADGLFVGYAIFDPKVRNKHFYDIVGGHKRSREIIQKTLNKMEEKNLVYLGGEKIVLTERGNKVLKELDFEEAILPQENWNGVWNLLSYDIPTKKKKTCDYFRRKLKEVGFTQVHKSLWLYPYDYKEEVAAFAHSLGIAPHVIYMQTTHIPEEEKYLKYYGLHKFALKRKKV